MKNESIHPLDVGYLVMGLIFLGVAGTWALRQAGVIELSAMEWLVPTGLIVAGVVGLVAAAAKTRRHRTSRGTVTEEEEDR